MLFKEFRFGKIFGIEFNIDISWLIIFGLVTSNLFVVYREQYYLLASQYPEIGSWIFVLMALGTSLLFFVSLWAHEMGHSIVAIRTGIPVQGITLFLFGGVAKITHEPTRPHQEFIIAIAGPIVSLALAVVFTVIAFIFPITSPFAIVFEWLGIINLVLAVFNLLPGFPMDGGRVLRSFIWRVTGNLAKATTIASWIGRGFAALLIGFGIARPFLLNDDLLSGVWMILIGLYLYYAAYRSGKQSVEMARLHNHQARELVAVPKLSIHSNQSLQTIMQSLLLTQAQPAAAVAYNNEVVGIVTLSSVLEVPRERWESTTAGEIMTPLKLVEAIDAQKPIYEVISRMNANRDSMGIFQIIEDGVFLGLVTRQEVSQFLRMRTTAEAG